MIIWDGTKVNYDGISVPSRYLFSDEARAKESPFLHPDMKVDMDLYGAAIAIIPSKNNPDSYKLTITPIAASNRKPTDFKKFMEYQVLQDLRVDDEFNILDTEKVRACFISAVHVLNELTTYQEESCRRAGKPTQPIALIIGQSKTTPANYDVILRQLFGSTLRPENIDVDSDAIEAIASSHEGLRELAKFQYLATGSRAVGICIDYLGTQGFFRDSARVASFNQSSYFRDLPAHEQLAAVDFQDLETLKRKFSAAIERKSPPYHETSRLFFGSKTPAALQKSIIQRARDTEVSDPKSIEGIEMLARALVLQCQIDIRSSSKFQGLNLAQRIAQITEEYKDKVISTLEKFTNKYAQFAIFERQRKCMQEAPPNEPAFIDACTQLTHLIDKVILKKGDFQVLGPGGAMFLSNARDKMERDSATQRELLREDPDAYYRLLDSAQKAGEAHANGQAKIIPNIFQAFGTTNLDESPQVRASFNDAFRRHYKGRHNCWIKQGLDEPAPFFVDPLLWMIADQHEVMFGSRHELDVTDRQSWKEELERRLEAVLDPQRGA